MWKRLAILVLGVALSQQAFAQAVQPDAMLLAQAQDRCLATYAVRLTKTDAADEEIYSDAVQGCKELNLQLQAAVVREFPDDQAKEMIAALQAQTKPNFLQMLQKIRSDRQIRAAK